MTSLLEPNQTRALRASAKKPDDPSPAEKNSSKVPAAFALFPKDISQPPREWAQRFFNVQRWTEMPRGGHFAALEEPAQLADS
jgi:pimeloyl-ACP methyl ester carboxylesterase